MPGGRRGRPRLGGAEIGIPISTTVTPRVYRVLKKLADARGGNVAATVRQVLEGRLGGDSHFKNPEVGGSAAS